MTLNTWFEDVQKQQRYQAILTGATPTQSTELENTSAAVVLLQEVTPELHMILLNSPVIQRKFWFSHTAVDSCEPYGILVLSTMAFALSEFALPTLMDRRLYLARFQVSIILTSPPTHTPRNTHTHTPSPYPSSPQVNKETVWVGNCHFESLPKFRKERLRQVGLVARVLAPKVGGLVLMGGDWNFCETDEDHNIEFSDTQRWVDCWTHKHPENVRATVTEFDEDYLCLWACVLLFE